MAEQSIQTGGPLFEMVQLCRILPDSKAFPDSRPQEHPAAILQSFKEMLIEFVDQAETGSGGGLPRLKEMLTRFVQEHFELPQPAGSGPIPPAAFMEEHIDNLWELLKRDPQPDVPPYSTLLPLPHAYVVPGGRFREIYHCDSYFTCEGLAASGRVDLLENMVRNFAHLIAGYGHIPNGNRVYYLSRSQPPFFCCMLQLLEREKGFAAVEPFLEHLEKEYAYWMDGAAPAFPGGPAPQRRTVRLEKDALLNRYWDDINAPRQEAFAQDVELFERAAPGRQPDLYRNLRAAAESGWDFSSRWLGPERSMTSMRTTEIIPVDLNSLLYNLENQLAAWLAQAHDPRASEYAEAAARRKAAIFKYCWNKELGWFFDYAWSEGVQTGVWSLAGVYPLFCGLADAAQVGQVAGHIQKRFLKPGGVVSTLVETGQQWDYPNGWAPLQWVTAQGLRQYGQVALAQEIARRFVHVAGQVYRDTGKMMEKYDVCDLERQAGGGEYPNQDGFGWTNGVVKAFIKIKGDET